MENKIYDYVFTFLFIFSVVLLSVAVGILSGNFAPIFMLSLSILILLSLMIIAVVNA